MTGTAGQTQFLCCLHEMNQFWIIQDHWYASVHRWTNDKIRLPVRKVRPKFIRTENSKPIQFLVINACMNKTQTYWIDCSDWTGSTRLEEGCALFETQRKKSKSIEFWCICEKRKRFNRNILADHRSTQNRSIPWQIYENNIIKVVWNLIKTIIQKAAVIITAQAEPSQVKSSQAESNQTKQVSSMGWNSKSR